YFVFDIIETAEAKPTKGRLAVPAEALAQAKTKNVKAKKIEHSEFEIDFKETIQSKTSAESAFEFDPIVKVEPFTKPTKFRTKAFDFEGNKSVFGE
ncbi:MAG: hypothetical protein VX014_00130, partial [Verrucomicrobiota bacterium]|nr:hypothetical protein [Verrucomicrobiota bacterium]